jgi:hypothetical protein
MVETEDANCDIAIPSGNVGDHRDADALFDCDILYVDVLEADE